MQYLTYEEYVSQMGGKLDQTAFSRNIDRACGIIDNATFNRIEPMREIPRQAKALCRDLVEYLAQASDSDARITVRSQSAGNVSESESYATKSSDDVAQDIRNMLIDYLGSITDKNGTPLLYRGCGC